MNRTLLSTALLGAIVTAACSDQPDPMSPASVRPRMSVALAHANSAVAVGAVAQLEDALTRIVPSLGTSPSARQVEALLRQIILQRGANDMTAVARSTAAAEALLDQLEHEQPALAPEIDAVRLALSADAVDRMHKPFVVDGSSSASRAVATDRASAADTATLTRKPADDERMHKPFIVDRMHKPF